MASSPISALTELAEPLALSDLLPIVDVSDTTDAASGTTKRNKAQYALGSQVNAQTGTSYTYLTTDFRKLVTHTNGSAIAGTLPQAGASFPAGWFMLVQNRGAGVLTITPTTSTIDGGATLVLNQNEGAIIVSDGTNYFTLRGKATGASGVGDVAGPGSATDNALARFDSTTGKLIQNSTVTLDDTGAITVPEMAAPSTPASNKVAIYAKSDGKLYIKDDVGTETDLTATGGGISGLTTNTIPKAASSTTLTDSPLTDDSVTISFGSRLAKTNQIYNGTASTVGSSDFYLDRFVGLRLGSDVTGFGFNDAYFDNIGRHTGFLKIVSSDSGGAGTLVHVPYTPSQFTANQNDLDIKDAYWQRWSSDASRDITGMRAANDAFSGRQADGETHLITNVGSNDIVLKQESGSSTAVNRFLNSTGADITLSANQAADVIYDGTSQRWRVFKKN